MSVSPWHEVYKCLERHLATPYPCVIDSRDDFGSIFFRDLDVVSLHRARPYPTAHTHPAAHALEMIEKVDTKNVLIG